MDSKKLQIHPRLVSPKFIHGTLDLALLHTWLSADILMFVAITVLAGIVLYMQ
jgi:hypothetical protein